MSSYNIGLETEFNEETIAMLSNEKVVLLKDLLIRMVKNLEVLEIVAEEESEKDIAAEAKNKLYYGRLNLKTIESYINKKKSELN